MYTNISNLHFLIDLFVWIKVKHEPDHAPIPKCMLMIIVLFSPTEDWAETIVCAIILGKERLLQTVYVKAANTVVIQVYLHFISLK